MTREELLAQAEALEWASDTDAEKMFHTALITMIRDRAAQLRAQTEAMPAQEPVAWMYQHEETGNVNFRPRNERWIEHRRYAEIPLYTAPPDLAERVGRLEELLVDIEGEYANYTGSIEMLPRIRAALAEGER